MYPGMMSWWMSAQRAGCGEDRPGWHRGQHGHGHEHGHAHAGWHGHEGWHASHEGPDDLGGGAFGVRRPLRFLAYRLELDDAQVASLAKILDELKLERAQAEVDRRRTLASFADALEAEAFDAAKAAEGGALRSQSAEKLRLAVEQALSKMHALLRADQRQQLAYLIRTGALTL